MKNYNIAKNILNLLSIFGWLIVGCGVIGFLATITDGILNALLFVGVASAVGFINIAIAQMGLAQIDTAENTSELTLLFKQYLAQSVVKTAPNLGAEYQPQNKPTSGDAVKIYKGYQIIRGNEKREFFVDGVKLMGIIAAEKHIDALIKSK
jgi:hypothetical protein